MLLSQMQAQLRYLVDDTVEPTMSTILFNNGQNAMAVEVKANFPQLTGADSNETFVFPAKFHEMPVLYAAAMVKTYDSSVNESNALMNQFREKLPSFIENYIPPYHMQEDINIQQFTGVALQNTYTITKDGYNPQNADLRVYVNDIRKPATLSTADTTFTLDSSVVVANNDYITVIWEIHADLNDPPYEFWRGMP